MQITAGTTDVSLVTGLINPTTNGPATGLTITDLDITYCRPGVAAVKADATALAAVDSVHGDNKAIELDSTNAKGEYRFDWPDAAFASGVNMVSLIVQDGDGNQLARRDITLVDGAVDWTASEKQQIRDSLGVDGDKTTATGGQVQAIKTKTDTIGSANMTVTSPVTEDGDVEIIAGDGYETSGGNGPLTFTVTDYAGPDLTAATAEFLLLEKITYDADATSEGTAIGTVEIAVDGTTVTYKVSLTAVQTAALAPSPPADKYNYVYQLRVTPAAGEKFTPALGALEVKRAVA